MRKLTVLLASPPARRVCALEVGVESTESDHGKGRLVIFGGLDTDGAIRLWSPFNRGDGRARRTDLGAGEPVRPAAGVPPPGRRRGWSARLDARTRSILAAAAAGALIVNAGAAWAYWRITGSATGRADAGAFVELTLRGRSDLNKPLTPGGTGNLVVTVTNDHDFPIRITSVAPGEGNIIADDEHREAGCTRTGVVVARDWVSVQWDVPRNTVGAFTVVEGLAMAPDSDRACAGATFTVPVQAVGLVDVS